jgi:hypothetical protein
MRTKVVLVGVLAGIALVPSASVLSQTRLKDEQVAQWVRNHIKALQPTPEEKRFDEIGWSKSIVEAEKLARQYNRPVFLFTNDGNIATGRCWGGAESMRAGPLSNNQVITLLNRYFTPVYSSNEDSGPQGRGVQQERAEHIRIYREATKSPCGAGAVFVFILDPEGRVIDGLDVAHASRGNALAEMLQAVVQKLHTSPGPTLVKPIPQSEPPASDPDSLVLHLTARSLGKVFPWGQFPAENWIVLKRAEWQRLLPPTEVKVGSSWTLPDAITGELLRNFYPPMEDIDTRDDRSRIEKASLRSTIISVTPQMIQARLDGILRMKRTFYAHANDNNYVDATVIGLLEFNTVGRQVRDFELTTDRATYGPNNPEDFGASLFSASTPTLASR